MMKFVNFTNNVHFTKFKVHTENYRSNTCNDEEKYINDVR